MKNALLLSLLLPLSASAATYELADLKALDKDQSWRELVEHLNDVVPSKRDAEWKAIAERACTGVLDPSELKDPASSQRTLDQIDELMKRYGWLKDSKTFMSKRAEVGFKAMGFTYQNSRHASGDDPWMERLKTFVAADAITADLPMRAIKLVNSRLVAVVSFPFVKPALARGGKAACKDTEVQQTILGALAEGSWTVEANEAASTCWDEFKPVLSAEVLKAGTTRTAALKLCPTLVEKKALSSEPLKKACTFN